MQGLRKRIIAQGTNKAGFGAACFGAGHCLVGAFTTGEHGQIASHDRLTGSWNGGGLRDKI